MWDFENRLSSVTLPGSGGTVSFKYDPFGRRIYKSSSSGTSIFAYDGDNLVEETNSSGTAVARYSQGLNIDEPLAMLRSSTVSYYESDGVGSVTSLSNAAGSLAQTYTFDSFGNVTAATGSLTNPFRYTGRDFDNETNLQFSRARYYDQTTGRFLSEDPIGFDGGDADFYRYALGSPLMYTDPLGLTVTCVYYQSSGILLCTDDANGNLVVNTKGYSGGGEGQCPKCVNNPQFQGTPSLGPIPTGTWNIGPGYTWNRGADKPPMFNTMRLTPQIGSSPDAFLRSPGFLIHGGRGNGARTASNGCIIIDPDSRRKIAQRGGGTMNVVGGPFIGPPYPPLLPPYIPPVWPVPFPVKPF